MCFVGYLGSFFFNSGFFCWDYFSLYCRSLTTQAGGDQVLAALHAWLLHGPSFVGARVGLWVGEIRCIERWMMFFVLGFLKQNLKDINKFMNHSGCLPQKHTYSVVAARRTTGCMRSSRLPWTLLPLRSTERRRPLGACGE